MTLSVRQVENISGGLVFRERDQVEYASPVKALQMSVRESDLAFEVIGEGRPLAYWGCKAEPEWGEGVVQAWLFLLEGAERHILYLSRGIKQMTDRLLTQYVEVRVHIRHSHLDTRAWLERLGYEYSGQAFGLTQLKKVR